MTENATQEVTLMIGTSGKPRYFPFARKGEILLGIAPQAMVPGEVFNHKLKGTTYFAGRLRSAPNEGLLSQASETVVHLGMTGLDNAWPGVMWEKTSKSRASTTVGAFIRGGLEGEESVAVLLKNASDGQIGTRMAEYLVSLAGADNMIVTERQLATWLNKGWEAVIAKLEKSIQDAKKIGEIMEESIGVFGIQAEQLKKAYASLSGEAEPDDTKADDVDDEDFNKLVGSGEPADAEFVPAATASDDGAQDGSA